MGNKQDHFQLKGGLLAGFSDVGLIGSQHYYSSHGVDGDLAMK